MKDLNKIYKMDAGAEKVKEVMSLNAEEQKEYLKICKTNPEWQAAAEADGQTTY